MATAAITSYGAALSIAATAVAQLDRIGGIKVTAPVVDATGHDSTSGWDELIASGRKRGEPIPIHGKLKVADTNGQVALKTALVAGTLSAIVITFPTTITSTWTFSAYVEDFEIEEMGLDGTCGFNATLRPSGVMTWGITASTGMSALTGVEENAGAALTFNPTFAIGTYTYAVSVNTASSYVKFTPTAASHTITITNSFDSSESTVATGNQSGELDLGAAATITTFTIKVVETGKAAKTYTVVVSRPAP